MTEFSNKNVDKAYDLEERTARFAEKVIDLVRKLPQNSVSRRLIEQCVGSLGANYCEANEAESKRDFALVKTFSPSKS